MITICSESVMKVWEAETGKLVYTVTEPHGSGVEITCIALDKTGYRLATGGFNGKMMQQLNSYPLLIHIPPSIRSLSF